MRRKTHSASFSRSGIYTLTIRRFLKMMDRKRPSIFLCFNDPMIHKTNTIVEYHFSVRPELLKNRYKADDGLPKASYLHHRASTEI